jgi:ABC-2 type transport system permease protein
MNTSSAKGSHVSRIFVIAMHAFTQLVRMKVFYFLAVFAVIAIASNFFDLPQHSGPESLGVNVLRSIKSWSLGTMTLFSVVLSIVATALLLPKDVEDRTLYTILAKPVPRFDYLAGKLLGVLMLVFVSLALMDLLMTAVLQIRTGMVMEQQVAMAQRHVAMQELPPETAALMLKETIDSARAEVALHGPSWSLQGAVVAVFLRASIMASLALLISTFSTSTLFTTIISFLIYFIGHFQADARSAYLQAGQAGEGVFARLVSLLVSLVLPDFQNFNVIDAVIEGQVMPLLILGKLALVALYYAVFFTVASWFIFAEKEF